jgi:hypothetical protein
VRTDTRYQVVVDGDPVAGERVRAHPWCCDGFHPVDKPLLDSPRAPSSPNLAESSALGSGQLALAVRLSFRLNSPRYNLGTQESALAVFAHLGRDLRAAGPGPSPGAPTGQARAIARLQMAKLDDLPQV